MNIEICMQLQRSLADSDSKARKFWARQIVEQEVPLDALLSLLHSDQKTAQRFTWLIGDICELSPEAVASSLPFLFSLRDQMPFPGMHRSIAKWLWLTKVPQTIEKQAFEQLFQWLDGTPYCIGSKSYAAKALYESAAEGRVSIGRLKRVLSRQCEHPNPAYSSRMSKLLLRLQAVQAGL